MRTIIVGPFQFEFAQYALKSLYPATGITSGLTAIAGQRRACAIRSVGIELLFDCARCQTQNLASRGGFDGFEIDVVGSAGTQQRIQLSVDVAGELRGERVFF